MKNTGITYTSAERSPVILPEMAELLPPLSAEQSAALEEDLLRNGCYSPVISNSGSGQENRRSCSLPSVIRITREKSWM